MEDKFAVVGYDRDKQKLVLKVLDLKDTALTSRLCSSGY